MKTRILVAGTFLAAFGVAAQTGDLKPGDNLVIENVPPIPLTLVDAVGRYTEFRAASFQSWHPTRREMLISTRFGNVPQAHVVKFPGGARTQMTFFPDRVFGARFDPKTGDSFIFSKDVGGDEFFQIYRYDFADGRITLLTDGKSRNTDPLWSNGGDAIAYGSTRRNGNDVDLYVVNPRIPRPTAASPSCPEAAGRSPTGLRTTGSCSPSKGFPSTRPTCG